MSCRLWLSRWLYERQLDDAAWVVFVPHRPGLPVVVDDVAHTLLHLCEQGADTEDVVRELRSRSPALTHSPSLRVLTAACRTLGLLTDEPEPPRFRAEAETTAGIETLSVWLYLTSRCNLDCGYCFVRKADRTMTETTLERAVTAVVSTAVARGAREVDATLAGGEPTLVVPLVERAFELLEQTLTAVGIGLRAHVVTNGTRVDDHLLAFLKRPDIRVSVSLDGFGPAHDIHRTFAGTSRGSWALVSANIEKLLDAGANVGIAATLSEDSCTSLADLIRWAIPRSLPVQVQVVSEPKRPWSGARPSAADFRRFNERLIASLEEAFLVLELHLARGLPVPELSLEEINVGRPKFSRCCGVGASYVAVTEDGEVAACPSLARTRRAPLAGDLITAAAVLLPRSPECRNDREDDPCLACRWFPSCTGGCTALNERVDGDEFSTSPLCPYRGFVIPRYVDYLGRKLLLEAQRQGIDQFRVLRSA